MPCCDTCACLGHDVECITVVDPVRFGHWSEWCRGTDGHKRQVVLARSRIAAGSPPPPPPPTPSPNPHAARRLLVLGCDYRLDPVGLEKGEGCSCQARTACLLRRGKWADDPARVDYADCLACVAGG